MRKIDKSKILSTKYKRWEENFEKKGIKHPEYNSSKNEYYTDVVMNLLHNQKGLCAYTEIKLCSNEMIDEKNWKNGKYLGKSEFKGQLDHFDPILKKEKGWLWSNFFVVDSDINTKVKKKQDVDYLLKPDEISYDEKELFEYDCKMHIFIANTDLDEEIRKKITSMIIKLGINFDPIIDKRKSYLKNKLTMQSFGLNFEIDEFPTAYKMCISNQ